MLSDVTLLSLVGEAVEQDPDEVSSQKKSDEDKDKERVKSEKSSEFEKNMSEVIFTDRKIINERFFFS